LEYFYTGEVDDEDDVIHDDDRVGGGAVLSK